MKEFLTPWDFFKKRLQLATFVSVDSFMLSIHLLDPEFLSYSQEHGVLVPNLLEYCHGHVRDLVTRAIEVGPDSFFQVGPSLAVCPRHADPVLVHPMPELRHCLPTIL